MNVDETSLSRACGRRPGAVVRLPRGSPEVLNDHQSLPQRRSNCTLLAAICNDPVFQTSLPQVLIGKWSLKDYRLLQGHFTSTCPTVEVVNAKGWMTSELFMQYIRLLRARVDCVEVNKKIVLMCDAAACHLTDEVLWCAQENNVRLLLVPSKMTSILQPLDVAVFAHFKKSMTERSLFHRAHNALGNFPLLTWAQCLSGTIDTLLLSRNWDKAFRMVGIPPDPNSFGRCLRAEQFRGLCAGEGVLCLQACELAVYLGKKGYWNAGTERFLPC